MVWCHSGYNTRYFTVETVDNTIKINEMIRINLHMSWWKKTFFLTERINQKKNHTWIFWNHTYCYILILASKISLLPISSWFHVGRNSIVSFVILHVFSPILTTNGVSNKFLSLSVWKWEHTNLLNFFIFRIVEKVCHLASFDQHSLFEVFGELLPSYMSTAYHSWCADC